MGAALGVCLDALNPAGAPPGYQVGAAGFGWCRMQGRRALAMYAYHQSAQAAGLKTAVVLDQTTFADGSAAAVCTTLALVIHPTVWIVGNEEDAPPGSTASWRMPPAQFGLLFHRAASAIRAIQPDAVILLGGFESGHEELAPPYLTAARRYGDRVDGIDVHPYAKTAAEAEALLIQYRALGLPLYVLEWNRPAPEIPGFVAMLQRVGVVAACWFCWSDGMVPGYGLYDLAGAPTAEATVLLQVVQGVIPMADGDEIQKLIAAHPSDVGVTYGEPYVVTAVGGWPPAGSVVLPCDGGILLELPGVPGAYCLTDGPGLIAGKFRAAP